MGAGHGKVERGVDRATFLKKRGMLFRAVRKVYTMVRLWLLRVRHPGLEFGYHPRIDYSRVRFDTWPGRIVFGDQCGIFGGDFTGEVIVGDRVNLMSPCKVGGSSTYKVSIGSDTWVAPNVYMVPLTHNYKHRDATISSQFVSGGDIIVGEDCWIGINAVISPGVTIGRGAVIGANSVVTKDIPEYAVAVGAPAKVISYRE